MLLCVSIPGLWGQSETTEGLQQQLKQSQDPAERVALLNQLAYQLYRGEASLAKSYAYQALLLSEQHELQEAEADSYVNLGRCFRFTQQWDSAFLSFEKAQAVAQQANYGRGLMNATNNLGSTYLLQGKTDEAKGYLTESLEHAEQLPDLKGQANANSNLAYIAEMEDHYDSALSYLDLALALYGELGDRAGLSRTLSNQGYLYDQLEQNDTAISTYFRALAIQEELALDYQISNTLNLIGHLYLEKGLNEQALEFYQRALSVSEQIEDIFGLTMSYETVGSTLLDLGKREEALEYLAKALEYARQSEDPETIGVCLVNLGHAYRDDPATFAQARVYYQEAEPLLLDSESSEISSLYDGLSAIAMQQGQYELARRYAQQELAAGEEFEDLESQQSALQKLQAVYRQKNQPEKALEYADQYHIIKDSLLNADALETINRLNIAYETEKKEKDNLRLGKELAETELEASEQRALRNLILGIGGVILVLALGGFGWYRNRQRLLIKEREMELEQANIRQELRRKEAEKLRELDAMKTRFFTNISHEFRTPLTLILGQNEQLQQKVANEQLKPRFEMVDRNGHRLLDLINQVLDVAKLEAGGMQVEAVQLDVIPFFKHLLFAFESVAEEKRIQLHFEGVMSELKLAVDLKKMERVLFNLLSNAVKFTPEGGNIRLIVRQEDSEMILGVQDSGIGIRADQLPYVFDRFYQADSSDEQPQPGTGIGLSLVKELVQLHGGKIWAESETGKGSTFWLRMPIPADLSAYPMVAQASEPQLNVAAVPLQLPVEEAGEGNQAGTKSQILIVEDNPDVRSYLRDQLIEFGYRVLEAKDGVEGVEKAKAEIPDLIISDIMMPRMDGYGLAQAIREDERSSHIPLILLTSKASDESKIKGFEHGIDDYLLKPFNSAELRTRIANLIEQRKRLRLRFSTATVFKPEEISVVPMDQQFLQKIMNTIEANLSNEQFGVEQLSEAVAMSITHLNRKLNALIGQSAGKLFRSMRLQRAADLLQQQAGTVSDIAYDMGFSSPAQFSRSFKKQFGVSPSEYSAAQK